MSSKKSHKSSCPFASANRADVLATTVIKSKIAVRTVPLVLAGRKLKAKAKTNPQNLLKSVSCRFCHADVTSLENVSARSGLRSCWIGSCQNEDCLSRTVHFSNHEFLGAFTFRSCNFLFDVCTRRRFPLFTQTLFPCLRHLSSCFVRKLECESTLARTFKK